MDLTLETMTDMRRSLLALCLFLVPLASSLPAGERGEMTAVDLLVKIAADEDADTRLLARSLAPLIGPPAVVPLGELIATARPEPSRTARAALERLVHHAGRPGAEAERGPVAAELARLLEAGRPAAVKREALHLIAHIGGDAAVAKAAALLEDPDPVVREQARLSLERIPGKAALEALLAAARRLPDARKPDLLFSIAKKGDGAAARDLAGFAAAPDAEVKLSALEALARLGAPESAEILERETERAAPEHRERLFGEQLRLADGLRAREPARAEAIYRRAIAQAPADHQRERALLQACPPGDAKGLPLLVAALTDASPRVRGAAGHRLSELKGPEVFSALGRAFEDGKPAEKPLLLRALAGRDPEAAKPHLERAAAGPGAELKITALDLLGRLDEPSLEPVYLRAAESGADWLRPAGLKGYLLLARRKLEKGPAAEALPMFGRVLDLARELEPRLEALKGIVAAGDPRSLERLQGLLKDAQLGPEAAKGYLKLAAVLARNGDRAGAERRLMEVASGEFSRELKAQATEEMRALGIDPQRAARSRGYLVNWHVVTPLPNDDGKGLERKDFPEETIELDKEHRVGERKFVWQKVEELSADGRVDLIPLFRRTEKRVTYAYAELDSRAEREVLFKMGSDDGIACWLNGEQLHLKNLTRGFHADEDSVRARLRTGKNKILLKVSQEDGDWCFSLRITDPEGKPLDLAAAGSL